MLVAKPKQALQQRVLEVRVVAVAGEVEGVEWVVATTAAWCRCATTPATQWRRRALSCCRDCGVTSWVSLVSTLHGNVPRMKEQRRSQTQVPSRVVKKKKKKKKKKKQPPPPQQQQ